MRILVTGGAGFIGSHLCDALINDPDLEKLICLDNLSSGNEKNIKHLIKNKKFIFVKCDITKPLKIKKIDRIFHLASMASPMDYQKYPIETLITNSSGTQNVIELALKNKSRLLFTSTSEVYGDPKESPQKEEYWGNVNPVGLRSCYDEGKRFSEALSMAYRREKNLNLAIIRIFNTYGPRMRPNDGRVISNFINQAIRNDPITVYGSGKQTRSFCYVSDMIEGLLKMMNSGEVGPINLGNPREEKVITLAKMIIKMTKSQSKIVFSPLPKDDPLRRKPDITKAKEKLNWYPEVNLENGLKKTIEYFSNSSFIREFEKKRIKS